MQAKTDNELVYLTRLGNKEAFGLLIERYQLLAQNVAGRMVRDVEVAHELVQEAMLQAFLSIDRLQNPDSFRSWLYGIVLNVCRGYLRNRRPDFFSLESLTGGLRFEISALAKADSNPQLVVEARELHQSVLAAVQVLPAKIRAATLLFYFDQLSLQEIAAILGISVVAVKGRLHKGRQQLKKQLLSTYLDMSCDHEAAYPKQLVKSKARSKTMLKATIIAIQPSAVAAHHVVVLLDEVGRRILPIWMGSYEADCIGIGLTKATIARPLAYNFMAKVIEAGEGRLEEVQVASLTNDTFYGIAKFRFGDKMQEIDCRPSDALALATITDSPIFVAEEVFDKAGMDVPINATKKPQAGEYYIQIQNSPIREAQKEATSSGKTLESFSEIKQNLIKQLFGVPDTNNDPETSG